MTIRAVAFMVLAFGPTVYLLHRWDISDRAALRVAIERGEGGPSLSGREKALRWLTALGLLALSWIVSGAAFPGPWL